MTEPTPPVDATQLSYADAMRELESIVVELEREAVDVDHLSGRVRRAAELVEVLRGRIDTARMDVARVLVDLDGRDSENDDDGMRLDLGEPEAN